MPGGGAAPAAACDLKPASVSRRTRGKLRVRPDQMLQAHPPKCCEQQSVTVPPGLLARFRQDLVYGSEEWRSMFATLRSLNEGMNGFLKDGAFEALDDPERRRLRGVAAQSILVALLVFAGNVRKIEAFKAKAAAISSGKVTPIRPRPRRRLTPSLESWDPSPPNITPQASPPTPA